METTKTYPSKKRQSSNSNIAINTLTMSMNVELVSLLLTLNRYCPTGFPVFLVVTSKIVLLKLSEREDYLREKNAIKYQNFNFH